MSATYVLDAAGRRIDPRAQGWVKEPPKAWTGDAKALEARLRRAVAGEVRFDAGGRAMYAVDASNYRHVPIGVVCPRSIDDVIATVALCREAGAPVLNRGGGTSLAGQCCNVAVVLDWTRHLRRVLEVDREHKRARVQPGLVLDALRKQTEPHGLTYGPDPATHDHCTFGGMIGNNSCGVHSVLAGRTEHNVLELEVLTYDGTRMRVGRTSPEELERIVAGGDRRAEIYRGLAAIAARHRDAIHGRFPDIPRRVSGYNLPALLPENGMDLAQALVGSEGTLVSILEAVVRLVEWPAARSLLVVGFEDVYAAARAVPAVLELEPIGLEGVDDRLIGDNDKKSLNPEGRALLPEGHSFLLVELGGETQEEADDRARRAKARLQKLDQARGIALLDPKEQSAMWQLRESGLGATARVPGMSDTWEGWEDSAVPPERLADYLRDLRELYESHGYRGAFYGHFGQGCVHTRISFDLYTGKGLDTFHDFLVKAADLCVHYGGSLSGEHGDGQSRGELLPRMFGDDLLLAFREVKGLFDPDHRMNPGKIVEPYPILSNLRLGPAYAPAQPKTVFPLLADDGSLARATMRCVGVGKCRRHEGGTMCPSYRVTGDEQHSTRGRAHLLHEMLVGEVITDGWRSQEVKEALDLCLACKGCKGDCPVQVDMATYKAEFLYHHYRRRLRPRPAYAMGLLPLTAPWMARLPRLTNLLMRAPVLSRLVRAAGGLTTRRELPRLATRTFRRRLRRRQRERAGAAGAPGKRVLLYPDTFTDFFSPEIGEAAVEVLEAAGFRVEIPAQRLCCGRPLYDYGFVGIAKRLLRKNLAALREPLAQGVPIVGLEPSCVAAFRDELPALFPAEADAMRLGQGFLTLAEFFAQHAPDWEPPRLQRKAVLHGHCHHKAVMRMKADQQLLDKLGLEHELLDSGCCGLAGSFGFEAAHYEVSMACAEDALLPLLRRQDARTLVLADGFSCRHQIEHGSERRGLHLAQVLQMALREGNAGLAATIAR